MKRDGPVRSVIFRNICKLVSRWDLMTGNPVADISHTQGSVELKCPEISRRGDKDTN